MRKTILTTTLALGLGVTGITAGQTADASEQDVNKEQLAEMAQADSNELNNAPLHAGEYNYNFNVNGVNYSFESDGTYYSWSYGNYDSAQPQPEVSEQEPAQNNTQEVQQEDNAPQVTEEDTEQTEQQATQNTEQSQQQENNAPQVTEENAQPAAPEQSSDQTQQQATQNTEQSADGSTKEQFLAAGGSEAMWQNIVMPESSGDPNAVNELGYQGLGQTKESWGTGSVEKQTEGMINYAQERYGSVDAAMEFREANNWW